MSKEFLLQAKTRLYSLTTGVERKQQPVLCNVTHLAQLIPLCGAQITRDFIISWSLVGKARFSVLKSIMLVHRSARHPSESKFQLACCFQTWSTGHVVPHYKICRKT